MHGGRAPQVRAAADRRLAEAAAGAAAVTLGLPVDVDPHTALLGGVHRAAGVVAYLETQVAALDAEAVTWGLAEESSGANGTTTKHAAGINVWVKLLGEWSDRLARIAKAAIDAGVSERLVRLEERKGELIAKLLADLIDDESIGLDDAQRERARLVAADKLRALPAA